MPIRFVGGPRDGATEEWTDERFDKWKDTEHLYAAGGCEPRPPAPEQIIVHPSQLRPIGELREKIRNDPTIRHAYRWDLMEGVMVYQGVVDK